MIVLFLLALIIAGCICAMQGLTIRSRLKKSEYLKVISKGTIFYGYSFPVALVFISEKLWGSCYLFLSGFWIYDIMIISYNTIPQI